jgi:hypothetical protein
MRATVPATIDEDIDDAPAAVPPILDGVRPVIGTAPSTTDTAR